MVYGRNDRKIRLTKRDNCERCKGSRGGVLGNENVIGGVVLCDYCSVDVYKELEAKKVNKMKIEKVVMTIGNRMLRIGVGQNEFRWFIRIDLWWVGYRVVFK